MPDIFLMLIDGNMVGAMCIGVRVDIGQRKLKYGCAKQGEGRVLAPRGAECIGYLLHQGS